MDAMDHWEEDKCGVCQHYNETDEENSRGICRLFVRPEQQFPTMADMQRCSDGYQLATWARNMRAKDLKEEMF